jgi:hypothetical protein
VSLGHRYAPGSIPQGLRGPCVGHGYGLGVAEVWVVALETPLIRLQLWSKPTFEVNVTEAISMPAHLLGLKITIGDPV